MTLFEIHKNYSFLPTYNLIGFRSIRLFWEFVSRRRKNLREQVFARSQREKRLQTARKNAPTSRFRLWLGLFLVIFSVPCRSHRISNTHRIRRPAYHLQLVSARRPSTPQRNLQQRRQQRHGQNHPIPSFLLEQTRRGTEQHLQRTAFLRLHQRDLLRGPPIHDLPHQDHHRRTMPQQDLFVRRGAQIVRALLGRVYFS